MSSSFLHNYNEKSKTTCLLTTISLTFILTYFFFPFNKSSLKGHLFKIIIIASLGTTLYFQLISCDELLIINELFSNTTNVNRRNQFLCSAVFSVMLLLFILFIGKEMFF